MPFKCKRNGKETGIGFRVHLGQALFKSLRLPDAREQLLRIKAIAL
jgi:hypothetical protein